MGINPYNKPQQPKEESDLDKVLKGLNVAGQLYGLYTDTQKVKEMKLDRELKDAQITEARSQFKETNDRAKSKDAREQAEFDAKQGRAPLEAAKTQAEINKLNRESKQIQNSKEPTQGQFVAATFGERAQKAEQDFAALKEGGFDRADRATAAGNSMASILGLQSQEFRRQKQGERNFVNALLRRESGAAISPSEFQNAEEQYFPRAGDDEATQKQKAENRAIAIAGLMAEGAPAASRVQGQIKNAKSGGSTGSFGNESPLSAGVAGLKPKNESGLKPPKVGEIKNGYQFKGGDPADKNSWVKK